MTWRVSSFVSIRHGILTLYYPQRHKTTFYLGKIAPTDFERLYHHEYFRSDTRPIYILKIQTKSFPIHLWVLFVKIKAVAFTYAESQPLRTFLAKFVTDDGQICRALTLTSRTRTITYQLTSGRIRIDFSSTRASRWCSLCLVCYHYVPRRVHRWN